MEDRAVVAVADGVARGEIAPVDERDVPVGQSVFLAVADHVDLAG